MSVYFGCITIVLKFPFTSAASTKGLQRYKGFGTEAAGVVVEGDVGKDSVEFDGNVAEVGVVDRLGGRGARVIERPIELKNDIMPRVKLPAATKLYLLRGDRKSVV